MQCLAAASLLPTCQITSSCCIAAHPVEGSQAQQECCLLMVRARLPDNLLVASVQGRFKQPGLSQSPLQAMIAQRLQLCRQSCLLLLLLLHVHFSVSSSSATVQPSSCGAPVNDTGSSISGQGCGPVIA